MTCILKGIGDAAGRHTLTETFRYTPMKLSNIGVFFMFFVMKVINQGEVDSNQS